LLGHIAQQKRGQLTGGGTGEAGGEVSVQVGLASGEAVQQVGQAAGAAVQQVGQAAAKATEQIGEAAVEARGKASWTPNKKKDAGQQRRPASRRSGEGQTKRSSKRGTRSRSSDGDGK
jgi:vacuolar-type H+-ATPase subunit H